MGGSTGWLQTRRCSRLSHHFPFNLHSCHVPYFSVRFVYKPEIKYTCTIKGSHRHNVNSSGPIESVSSNSAGVCITAVHQNTITVLFRKLRGRQLRQAVVPAATRTSVGITSKSASATYVVAELEELASTTAHSEGAGPTWFTSLHRPASSPAGRISPQRKQKQTKTKEKKLLSGDEMVQRQAAHGVSSRPLAFVCSSVHDKRQPYQRTYCMCKQVSSLYV